MNPVRTPQVLQSCLGVCKWKGFLSCLRHWILPLESWKPCGCLCLIFNAKRVLTFFTQTKIFLRLKYNHCASAGYPEIQHLFSLWDRSKRYKRERFRSGESENKVAGYFVSLTRVSPAVSLGPSCSQCLSKVNSKVQSQSFSPSCVLEHRAAILWW